MLCFKGNGVDLLALTSEDLNLICRQDLSYFIWLKQYLVKAVLFIMIRLKSY